MHAKYATHNKTWVCYRELPNNTKGLTKTWVHILHILAIPWRNLDCKNEKKCSLLMQLQMTSLFPRNTWKPNPWVVMAVLINKYQRQNWKVLRKARNLGTHECTHRWDKPESNMKYSQCVFVFCSRELPWNRNRWVQSSRHHAYRLITSKQVSLHDRFWIRSVGRPYLIHDRKNDHSAFDHSYKKNAQLPVDTCMHIYLYIYTCVYI